MSFIGRSFFSIVVALALATPAAGEDLKNFGFDQFKMSRNGSEVMVCGWFIYLSVQAITKYCDFPRRPSDEAIDEAVHAMDETILANALFPTREKLDEFKRHMAAASTSRAGSPKACESTGSLEFFRSQSPDTIRSWTKAALATPKERVAAPFPCL